MSVSLNPRFGRRFLMTKVTVTGVLGAEFTKLTFEGSYEILINVSDGSKYSLKSLTKSIYSLNYYLSSVS